MPRRKSGCLKAASTASRHSPNEASSSLSSRISPSEIVHILGMALRSKPHHRRGAVPHRRTRVAAVTAARRSTPSKSAHPVIRPILR